MKKLIKTIFALTLALSMCACSSSTDVSKKSSSKAKTEEKQKEKIYTTGETVTYSKNKKDLVNFTVESAQVTDERNQFDDSNPAQVVIIKYNYENLNDDDEVCYTSVNLKVIDEGGNVCETYPAVLNAYAQQAPKGTKSEGEVAYGLKQQSSKIKLIIDFDFVGTKATYELPLQ